MEPSFVWKLNYKKVNSLILKLFNQAKNIPVGLPLYIRVGHIVQGVPINMGIQWRIRYRLCYELAL